MLRILAHLLGKSLQEFVHGRAQLIHQLLDFFVARAAFERLTERLLRLAQCLFGLRDVSVFELYGHVPQPRHHFAQGVVVFRILKIEIDRAQAEIGAGFLCEALRRDSERVKRGKHQRLCFPRRGARIRRCSISARARGLTKIRCGSVSSCG